MSRMFAKLLSGSRRISRDEYALNFGGIAEDVAEMLEAGPAQEVVRTARQAMEEANRLDTGQPRLQRLSFGLFSTAPELERGQVAAVDGVAALPLQLFSAGQAVCVGVGSLSHRRPMVDSVHYWSSKAYLERAYGADDFIAREEQGAFGISQTAYLRYFEFKHGLEIEEPFLFFDGTLVYDWLTATREGVELYEALFASGKKAIGILRSAKVNPVFAKFGRALNSGELYVAETLADHLERLQAGADVDVSTRYTLPDFFKGLAPQILRGVFKPGKKAFGFEVHQAHFADMIRIRAADCQMNYVGREVPYLLNRVDEEVRRYFRPGLLRDRIAANLAQQREELFLEEKEDFLSRRHVAGR